MADFVFAYGSLIERASRTRTNPDAIDAWPARVKGVSRGWFHQFTKDDYLGSTCTFLGAVAVEDPNATINGVIYRVSDLRSTIIREKGYTLTELDPKIEMLDGKSPWNDKLGKVFIFLSADGRIAAGEEPTAEIPMVQSYVDMCINGCLEIDALYPKLKDPFVEEFIRTTTGWNKYWVNDRIYPRRPGTYCPTAQEIDKALQKAIWKEGPLLELRHPLVDLPLAKGQYI